MTYRVDVLAYGESRWATNALRFDSVEEATTYAHDLHSRWMMADKLRVVSDDTPTSESYNDSDERIVIK